MRKSLAFRKYRTSLAMGVATAAVLLVQVSFGAPMVFVASLVGGNENPPTSSSGTGTAIVILDPAANTLNVNVTFGGLTGLTTASHIHCCEATPSANVNVGVATTTPTFAGFPLGVTSGTYTRTLDLTLTSSYNPAFIAGAFDPGHTVAGAEAALVAGIENAETYLNIHSTVFPGGEVRGTLILAQLTPLVPAGAARNAFAVAGAIDAVFASGNAPPEFVALLLNTPTATLPDALERIAGENESAAAQAGNESLRQFLSLVLDPFAGTRPGQQAPLGTGAIWGAAYGGHLRISGTAATGSPADTNEGGGLAVGFDYSVAPGTFAGAAFSFDHRDFSIAQSFGGGHDSGYQFALYGETEVDAFYLAAAGDYSIYDFRTSRSVSLAAASGNYLASYTGHGFGGRVEAGLHAPFADLDATPFAALLADSISMPAYSETTQSGSATFAMQSPSHSFNRVRSELGLGVSAGGPVLLHARAGWAHEFAKADSIPFAFEAFPGQSFTVSGTRLKDSGFVSAGLMMQVAPGVTLGGSIEGDFGPMTGYGGSAALRAAW
jgi:outer membrane autotransporter protein